MVDSTTMFPYCALVIITFYSISSDCLSIDKQSETPNVSDAKEITKREAAPQSAVEFYPDWVPFKNKHGEDLGEFKQVPRKSKLKKRLALPVNFLLRAVAEPDGDDYYDKGQGEGEGDDNFEKSDWSDTNRPANKEKVEITPEAVVNHPDLVDIDGIGSVVDIIKTIPKNNFNSAEDRQQKNSDPPAMTSRENDDKPVVNPHPKPKSKNSRQKPAKVKKEVTTRYEDDVEYLDISGPIDTKRKDVKKDEDLDKEDKDEAQEEEGNENDANKSKILDSVDALRERHVQEQKMIAAKAKEDLVYAEERERDNINTKQKSDKYDYDEKPKKTGLFYDDYDDRQSIIEDKYQIIPLTRQQGGPTTVIRKQITTIAPASETTKRKKIKKKEKEVETKSGKLSVFKNPRLFMIYDDIENENHDRITTKAKPSMTLPRLSARFSKDINVTKPETQVTDSIRISLVPEDGNMKSNEPALFFPKHVKTRSKKRKPARLTDNSVSQSKQSNVTINPTGPTAAYLSSGSIQTAPGNGLSASLKTATASLKSAPTASLESAPSGSSEIAPTASASASSASLETAPSGPTSMASDEDLTKERRTHLNLLTNDTVTASSDHKKEGDKEIEHEHGGEKEYHSKHEEDHKESGKKAYEGHHKSTKAAQGHHDKESHRGTYDDHRGHDKEHHKETGHFGDHLHEEHGKKHAEYEESGKHSKGHSTKGSHDVHKKDEYEKKVEFFEEDGDTEDQEKIGGYSFKRSNGQGNQFKRGGFKGGDNRHAKGETGRFVKGGHGHFDKGHISTSGQDEHHGAGGANFHREGKQAGKKWIYHHGHPAKNANLVVIDRRADQAKE